MKKESFKCYATGSSVLSHSQVLDDFSTHSFKKNRERKFQWVKDKWRASLVAQWLRIRLPTKGTWVRALVQEDPTCCGATKLVRYNY